MAKLFVKDTEITIISIQEKDYISLTDIAKAKNPGDPNGVIANWLRNRNTIEFLGIWEYLYNPNFKPLEFEGFMNEALEQLVVLSNMESINALLIRQELPQSERLVQLNNVAITQMRSLLANKKTKMLK